MFHVLQLRWAIWPSFRALTHTQVLFLWEIPVTGEWEWAEANMEGIPKYVFQSSSTCSSVFGLSKNGATPKSCGFSSAFQWLNRNFGPVPVSKWIRLRENLEETPFFLSNIKVSCSFSLKPMRISGQTRVHFSFPSLPSRSSHHRRQRF